MKYTIEYIIKCINDAGYTIIGDIINANNKVLCETKDGYKVLIMPKYLIERGDKPDIFSKYNPYTVENIDMYIKNHNYTCKLLTREYKNKTEKMEYQCECGNKYLANIGALREGKRYCNYCAKSKRYDNKRDYKKLIEEECKKKKLYTIARARYN